MLRLAHENRAKPARNDKSIRLSRETWERLRKVRAHVSGKTDQPVESYDEAINILVDNYWERQVS